MSVKAVNLLCCASAAALDSTCKEALLLEVGRGSAGIPSFSCGPNQTGAIKIVCNLIGNVSGNLPLELPTCLHSGLELGKCFGMKQLRRVVRPRLVVALLFCSLSAFSQRPEPRLKGTTTETVRMVLSDSRTARARAAQDLAQFHWIWLSGHHTGL